MSTINQLTQVLLSSNGMYLLGAGASAPIVPVGNGLLQETKKLYCGRGIFPAAPMHQNQTTKRAIKHRDNTLCMRNEPSYEWVINNMSSGFVQVALFHMIAQPALLTAPPCYNYQVFNYFPPSVIFNYNLDGLADKFIENHHIIISQHGTINRLLGGQEIAKYLNNGLMLNSKAILTNHVLIEEEPIRMREELNVLLRRYFHECKFIAIVGYTFGQNDGQLDDIHSFDQICKYLTIFPKPVFVIDPHPELVERIREHIKSNNVYSYKIYWNKYAEAISIIMHHKFGDISCAEYLYNSLLYEDKARYKP